MTTLAKLNRWRAVSDTKGPRAGCRSARARRTAWWALTLECGHTAKRAVRPARSTQRAGSLKRNEAMPMTSGRVGEGRNPLSVLEARVPAGVVHVQVRVGHHHVHLIGSDVCGNQIREEARVQVRERGQRPVLPLPAPVSMRVVLPSLRSTRVFSAPI